MIEASFDRSSRLAAMSGVYQYDTGQRLRMRGLPSPDELLARDDLLSGTTVTVQVQFGYLGDEQTDMGLAKWDNNLWCWVVSVPDAYLTRTDPVNVYVYMYYGESERGSRSRTEYEGVFTPISRPAPGNVASDDMIERWRELEAEVDLALVSAGTAIENAEKYADAAEEAYEAVKNAAEDAQRAADAADEAAQRLEAVRRGWDDIPVQVIDLPVGPQAYVEIQDDILTYNLPRGEDGEKGEQGDTGPSDITFEFSDGILTITPK